MLQKFDRLTVLVGFGLVLLGAKLWLLAQAGHALPTWDQWDSECEITLRPWVEGRLAAQNILSPHVEHRIVTTKLSLVGLLAANGQWDNLVEAVFGAIVHSLCGVLIIVFAWRWMENVPALLLGALVVLLMGLPFAWQNTLVGFQVQFYYVLLFSILHIHLVTSALGFSLRWCIGMLSGALAVVSMASGLLAPAAVAAVLCVRLLKRRRCTSSEGVALLITLAFAIGGWMLKSPAPGHDFLKAATFAKFIWNIFLLSSWPASLWFPWTVVIALPSCVFMYRWMTESRNHPGDHSIGTFCLWQFLQICAISYSRGGAGTVLTSRYLDVAAFGVVLNWICLAREFNGRCRPVVGGLWLTAILVGLAQQSVFQWETEILPENVRRTKQEENVRGYLHTADRRFIDDKPFAEIPYPSADILASRLSHASIRSIMPWTVRDPMPIRFGADVPRGMPPAFEEAPAPVALSTWSLPPTATDRVWRSLTHRDSGFPILRFRLAGDIRRHDQSLRLVVKSKDGEVEVSPDTVPNNRWKSVSVTRPPGDWWIEVTDKDPLRYFAFTEPVELSRGSYLVGKLIKSYLLVGVSGAVLISIGLVIRFKRRRFTIQPSTERPQPSRDRHPPLPSHSPPLPQ